VHEHFRVSLFPDLDMNYQTTCHTSQLQSGSMLLKRFALASALPSRIKKHAPSELLDNFKFILVQMQVQTAVNQKGDRAATAILKLAVSSGAQSPMPSILY